MITMVKLMRMKWKETKEQEIFFQKNKKSLTTNVAGGVVTLMISKQTPEDGDDGGSAH